MIREEDKIFHLLADKFIQAALLSVLLLGKNEIFVHLFLHFIVVIVYERDQTVKSP